VIGPSKELARSIGVSLAPAVFASDWKRAREHAGLMGAPELEVSVPEALTLSMSQQGHRMTAEYSFNRGPPVDRDATLDVGRVTVGVIADVHLLSFSTHFVGSCVS